MQRQYGKAPDDLRLIVEGFARILARYTAEQVIATMDELVLRSPNIPTPSEIVAIIDPPVEPFRPDWPYYNRLRDVAKGGPFSLGQDEIDYMQACERHSRDRLSESQSHQGF